MIYRDNAMKLITFEDIRKLGIPPKTCFNWVSEMIEQKQTSVLPPKISLHPAEDTFCNFMPCIIATRQSGRCGGVKIVNRYPLRQPSLDSQLILMDMENGNFLALMDANWITAMRTGAVAVHSIQLLAKKNFQQIAMIGLGNTARATLLVLADVFPQRDFFIKLLRYKGQETLFAERFKAYPNLHFTCADTPVSAIEGADIVLSCATYFANDLCEDSCFDAGVLVVPVHTRGFSNCDLFFDKVYADDTGHVSHFKNFNRFRHFAEISDVVCGAAKGRENDVERILVYNIGLAIHDIYFSHQIYQAVQRNPGLTDIAMHNPAEKFWV